MNTSFSSQAKQLQGSGWTCENQVMGLIKIIEIYYIPMECYTFAKHSLYPNVFGIHINHETDGANMGFHFAENKSEAREVKWLV